MSNDECRITNGGKPEVGFGVWVYFSVLVFAPLLRYEHPLRRPCGIMRFAHCHLRALALRQVFSF